VFGLWREVGNLAAGNPNLELQRYNLMIDQKDVDKDGDVLRVSEHSA